MPRPVRVLLAVSVQYNHDNNQPNLLSIPDYSVILCKSRGALVASLIHIKGSYLNLSERFLEYRKTGTVKVNLIRLYAGCRFSQLYLLLITLSHGRINPNFIGAGSNYLITRYTTLRRTSPVLAFTCLHQNLAFRYSMLIACFVRVSRYDIKICKSTVLLHLFFSFLNMIF